MTEIMGILNLTPDSFSGDGQQGKSDSELLAHVDAMIADGAMVIDVGAESTRPGATPLSAEQEWQRVMPLVKALGQRLREVTFSIDSYHPENAKRAIDAGFTWVNDVSGGTSAMLEAVKASGVKLVLMHSLSVPADKTHMLAADADPVAHVLTWGHNKLLQCEQAGIARDRIILDPGIGFGKSAAQSIALLRHIELFKVWNVPLLVGHSRKSFLSSMGGSRDMATLAVSTLLAHKGVDYIRVHDIAAHSAMLQVVKALA